MAAKFRHCYFGPHEAIALGNYFIWDHARYTFPWIIEPADLRALAEARYEEALNRQALGWPAWYYEPFLFQGELKKR